MMGFTLAIIVAGLVIYCRKRITAAERQARAKQEKPVPAEAEDDILAVVSAALMEFESAGDFKVLKIKPSCRNWTITGRQEQLRRRM